MIKKLRRKFVIINMSLVAVILCVVLGMFCFTRAVSENENHHPYKLSVSI